MTQQAHSKVFAATGLIPVARLFAGIFTILCCVAPMAWAASTTTTLAVTSNGNTVTTVASGSVATLTAMVKTGSKAVTVGQVNFCDAAAKYCTDIHLLGMAQLTKAGTAVFKFRPGVGSHSYKAVFIGTKSDAGSSSSVSELTVTGEFPTATTITSSGNVGNYTLATTVKGYVNKVPGVFPTGTVSFLDTSNGNDVLGTAKLGMDTPTLNWANSQIGDVGNQPYDMAVGDFNGDGIPDLAVVSQASTVAILLGNGDGTFTAAAGIPVAGSGASSIAVGDFNGDGILDLAFVDYYNSTLTIALGNGDGTFKAPVVSQPPLISPSSIAVGDFNGDGILDLAVANYGSLEPNGSVGSVAILQGNGDGTFTAVANQSTVVWPESIAVGDFNGDGIPDLVLTRPYNNAVAVFLGNGDGTFKQAASLVTAPSSYTVAVGDFKGNGKADLAVGNYDNDTVSIFLGNGDGTFKAGASPVAGGDPYSIAVGDFNGDGILDLAVGNQYGATVTILLGNGDGTFEAATTTPAGPCGPSSLVIGDFNGDGVADLAVANDCTLNEVTVLQTELMQTATATVSGISIPGTGTHLVEASYPGDSNYGSSVSGITLLTAYSYATLLSPTPGSVLGTTSTTFTWTRVAGVTAYELYLGTRGPGSDDLIVPIGQQTTSRTIPSLPANGVTVYARLYSKYNGVWQYIDYTYTESGTATPPALAKLTTPAPGSVLGTSSITFSWTSGSQVWAYQLNLGTKGPGSYDLIAPIGQQTTSRTVPSLPANGATVYARLYSKIAGVWKYNDYTYKESGTAAQPALKDIKPPAQ